MKGATSVTFLLLWVAATSGCGTIVHGRDQAITISSSPPGAEVLYDGAVRGITPCTINVSRRPFESYVLVRKNGYENQELLIANSVSMWALLGNVVIGGVAGYAIDASTGSFGAYYTDSYHVSLRPDTLMTTGRSYLSSHALGFSRSSNSANEVSAQATEIRPRPNSFAEADDAHDTIPLMQVQENGSRGRLDNGLYRGTMADWRIATEEAQQSAAIVFVVAALNVEGTTGSRLWEVDALAAQLRSCIDGSVDAQDRAISEVAEVCRRTLGFTH